MLRQVFLLRHGESAANGRSLIVSRRENGGEAYGLTERGREQVAASVGDAAAAGTLGTETTVVSSPFLRTIETARVASDLLGTTFVVEPRLAERDFGQFELASSDAYVQVWERDRIDPTHAEWGVEPISDVLTRALQALDSLRRASDAVSLLVCTHGDVASALLCHAAGAPLSAHREVGALAPGQLVPLRVGPPSSRR